MINTSNCCVSCVQVFSVGTPASVSVFAGEFGAADVDALNFRWCRSASGSKSTSSFDSDTSLTVQLASVRYLHSPQFLNVLKTCAADFQQYLSKILRQTAKDVAMGVVVRGTRSFAEKMDVLSTSFLNQSMTFEDDKDDVDGAEMECDHPSSTTPVAPESSSGLKLKVTVESPVIAVPKSSSGGHVIVANLGHIDLQNSFENVTVPQFSGDNLDKALHISEPVERRVIQVRNMHLAALQLDVEKMKGWDKRSSVSLGLPPYFLTSSNSCGTVSHILHDTEIAATVDTPLSACDEDGDETLRLYAQVKVVGSLRVSISKDVFQQVTATLDAVSSNPESSSSSSPAATPSPDTPKQQPSSRPPSQGHRVRRDQDGVIFMPSPSLSSSGSHSTVPGSEESGSQQQVQSWSGPKLHVQFHVPIMKVELRTVLCGGEQGLVDISLHDFLLQAVKCQQFVTAVEISLRSLVVEDLLERRDSRYRFLMSSAGMKNTSPSGTAPGTGAVFASFPGQMHRLAAVVPMLGPLSLGSPVHRVSTPNTPHKTLTREPTLDGLDDCDGGPIYEDDFDEPVGAHGSTGGSGADDETLVQVTVRLVDKNAPNFFTDYNGVSADMCLVSFSSLFLASFVLTD